MEIKTTYIAFDGKEFDDEDLCTEYEGKIRYPALLEQAKFYDRRGNRVAPQYVINDNDIAYFISLPTEEAVKQYKKLEEAAGHVRIDSMAEPGFYFYEDTGTDEYWHRVEDFPEYIANTYDSYRMAKSVKEQLDNED